MKRLILLAIVVVMVVSAQQRRPDPEDPRSRRMPDGRTQAEHILEHEHEKSLEDVAELVKLSGELKVELEKNDHHVLSVNALRKAEEIEKLAKKIKNRLKRF